MRKRKYFSDIKKIKYYYRHFPEFCLLIFFLIFSKLTTHAQSVNEQIDSLKALDFKNKNIYEQIYILNQISTFYNKNNPDSALHYSDIAIKKAKKNNADKILGVTYYQRGVAFKNVGIIDSARYYIFSALKIFEDASDIENIIQTNIAIGEFYRSIHNLLRASDFIKTAINLSDNKNIITFLPHAYNRLGAITFELAFDKYKEKPNIKKEYLFMSIKYIDTSFLWSEKNHNNNYYLSNFNIMGACHQNLNDFKIAITYYEKALKVAEATGEITEKPIIYRNLGSNYCKIKNFEKALLYGLKGYHLADSLGIKNNMIFAASSLYETYFEMGNYYYALKYNLLSDSIKSIVYDETYLEKTKEFEAKYENQKKQIQIETLTKEKEIQNAEVKKQKIIIYFFIIIFIITMVLFLIIYRFFRQNKKTSAIISNKNQTLEFIYTEINQQNEKIKSQNEEIKFVNEKLREFNIELENKVRIRTIELQEKNEQIEAQNLIYKKINDELKIAKEKSEENDRLKSAFLANMSHEIRTPLNGILGFSKLLTNQDMTEENQKNYLEIINNSGQQLLTLIDDIIDMAKIEVNQVTISSKPFFLNNLINEIFLLYQSKNVNTEIKLFCSKDLQDEQSIIITDGTRLKQILLNLIGNAIKFTKTGFIKFGYLIKDNLIEFYVIDTGIGIAADKQEIIFERFRQAETNISQTYGGTGLGLSISKSLIQLLGGNIRLESELNKGSKFYFSIPYIKADTAIPKFNQINLFNKIQQTNNNKTILIAEDEENNYVFIKTVLSKLNLNILHAKNGKEAIELILQNQKIALVLMDIKMPEMNGYEALKEIRKIRENLPVIAQTAYAQTGDKEKAIESGFNDYLTKPINIQLLTGLILNYTKD